MNCKSNQKKIYLLKFWIKAGISSESLYLGVTTSTDPVLSESKPDTLDYPWSPMY